MKARYVQLLTVCLLIIGLEAVASKPTICLNMIVKDEKRVIERSIGSVKPLIDYWIIVDTGSTDGTQEIIKTFLKDIPGELHERPWKNFAHNRNEALALAKGKSDYVLFIDADEELILNDFTLPHLDRDFYYIDTHYSGSRYKRVQLINNHLPWKWAGVLHEAVVCDSAKTCDSLVGLYNLARPEGNRSLDPLKYHKDAAVLEQGLRDEPNNTRYMFYLAQSYKDAGELEKALDCYRKRIAMGGWDEELYISKLKIAMLQEVLLKDPSAIIEGYKEAYTFRPSRAEALYQLAVYLRSLNRFEEAFQYASKGLSLEFPKDLLFIENWMHDYGLLMEYSVSAYWTNRFVEALIASKLMLANPELPDHVRSQVQANLVWINQKLSGK